jgi:hypothetical protein
MIKNFYLEYFYYLSPLLAIFILVIIIGYLRTKLKRIKVLPKDYLKFYHYERKVRSYVQITKLYQSIISFIVNLLIKILQRFKTESLKLQVWTEKHLMNLKNIKENQSNQVLENNLTDDKTS